MDKRYRVELSRVEYQYATIEVEAESEEAAREYAMSEVSEWTCKDADQSVDSVEPMGDNP